MAIVYRRQIPKAYKRYKSFKKHLRIDFKNRCAYCRRHERQTGSSRAFGVDHFRPKKTFKNLVCTYGNLYYCCNDCNSVKRDIWPDQALLGSDFRFIDCCVETSFGRHYRLEGLGKRRAGHLIPLTNPGTYTVDMLQLNREDLVEERKEWLEMWSQIRNLHGLVLKNRGLIDPAVLGGLLRSLSFYRQKCLCLTPLKK